MTRLTSRLRARRTATGALLVLLALVVLAVPIAAITWGWKDTNNQYPEVGDILVTWWGDQTIGDCTGTLISPRVVLTAGHCAARFNRYLASGDITDIRVSFDVEPFGEGATTYKVRELVPHPKFAGLQPRSDPYDVGVVILETDVDGITPAALPTPGFLNQLLADGRLGHGTNAAKFTVVGYGASLSFPPPRPYWENVRQYGFSEFRALLPAWLRMSQQGRTGDQGGCYDDSGAPTFWEEGGERTLVAIMAWGDVPCVSSEFNYRVDLPESLAFINDWIE